MEPLLEAKKLTKLYGTTIALASVNLEVHEGITGLLGLNGASKSTAIKLFLGLLKPSSGTAEVLGQKPYESVDVRARTDPALSSSRPDLMGDAERTCDRIIVLEDGRVSQEGAA